MGLVLIVDDEEDIRAAMRDALVDAGHDVEEAGDGEEALELLRKMPTLPCVMLLDLMMPRMGGEEALEIIGREPRLASVPVVIVTAYGGAILGRPMRVLRKPITLATLLKTVAAFCP